MISSIQKGQQMSEPTGSVYIKEAFAHVESATEAVWSTDSCSGSCRWRRVAPHEQNIGRVM
jgi:hypothetical protein